MTPTRARVEVDDAGEDLRSTDRHDCPACHGTWIRMVAHDRTGIALRCVRCGCRFTLAAVGATRVVPNS